MRKAVWILSTVLLALIVVPGVQANSTTTYKVNFNLSYGSPLPTSGSFVYDNTTNQFLSFTMHWDGWTFDLPSSNVNAPKINYGGPPCIGGATGPQATLALMITCDLQGYPAASWGASVNPNMTSPPEPCQAFFGFSDVVEGAEGNVPAISVSQAINLPSSICANPNLSAPVVDAGGGWIATPTAVRWPPHRGFGLGQIIRVIAGPVYVPPGVPVEVNLGFVDINGVSIGPALTQTLTQGQTATLDLSADALQLTGRTLVRPVVTLVNPNGLPTTASGAPASVFIPEVSEVFDAATGFGRELIPGDTEFAANPTFAFQGLALGETMQIIVSGFPNTGCSATLGFADINGNPVGPTKQVNLQPGQADSLEVHAITLGIAPGQRMELQPVVSPFVSAAAASSGSACQATTEVFDTLTGRTWTYQPGERQLPAVQ